MQLFAINDIFSLGQLFLAVGCIMAFIAIALIWQRERGRRLREIKARMRHEEKLVAQIGIYEALFNFSGQSIVAWDTQSSQLWMSGTGSQECYIPRNREEFLTFSNWLPKEAASTLTQAVETLKREGVFFDLSLARGEGEHWLDVKGRHVGSWLIITISPVAAQTQEYWQQKARGDDLEARLVTLQMLLDEVKQPVWMRDHDAAISWGNRAYFRISGADYEFLPRNLRDKIKTVLTSNESYSGKVPTIIQGNRHILDMSVVAGPSGSAGIAFDHTQLVSLKEEADRTIAGYLALFNELPTAVAIFNAQQKLEFFNQAFVSLWPLDVAFLESRPSHALVLDRLRENQILAENPEWRAWKERLFEAYHKVEPQLNIWHLPDGRTLRVVAIPGPQDGVTWLYEDLSEKLQLEARYNTLIHMQGETLDHLHEGVALFGSDGRLRLANPAFAHSWGLPPDLAIAGVHINQIENFCAPLCAPLDGRDEWHKIATQVTDFTEARETLSARIELFDGQVRDYMLVPLPQGQTMLSFVDVSDSVRVARALAERNEALESANRLRTDFVSHVSYQLRTPLTNIIGFTDLLRTPAFGPLSGRQREYLDNIGTQSIELLNLVNDILDLATVDAGIMQLDIDAVDIAAAMQAAAERVEERLVAKKISLDLRFDGNMSYFYADAARLRQILFNLLLNAANFAPIGSTIGFSAQIEQGEVIFQVRDEGAGIPDEILGKVFERFCVSSHHGNRAGAGLGLSLVKSFVELHHGRVEIATGITQGTTIRCYFPVETPLLTQAAQ